MAFPRFDFGSGIQLEFAGSFGFDHLPYFLGDDVPKRLPGGLHPGILFALAAFLAALATRLALTAAAAVFEGRDERWPPHGPRRNRFERDGPRAGRARDRRSRPR